MFEVANRLKERGYDVRIIALQGPSRSWFNLKVPVEYVKASLKPLRQARLRTKIFFRIVASTLDLFSKIIAKNRLIFVSKIANSFSCDIDWAKALADAIPECDICIATWFPTALSVWMSGKGKPFYLMQDFPEQIRGLAQRQLLEATYRLPFNFLADSTFLSEIILQRQVGAKVKIVGAGINPETFFPSGPRKKDTIMAILNDSPNKDADTMVQALNRVHVLFPIQAMFVGSDTALKKTKPEFPYVFFEIPNTAPEHDKTLAKMYSSADVFAFSSTVEGFGLPPLEAMACGTLVVTTDCKGNRDYAVNEYNCLIVPARDPDAMADAIFRVLSDDRLRNILRAGAFETAKLWTWDRVVDNFELAFSNDN